MTSPDLTFLKDLPSGQLDQYRKDASFGWKQMAVFMEGEKLLRYKVSEILFFLQWLNSEQNSISRMFSSSGQGVFLQDFTATKWNQITNQTTLLSSLFDISCLF